jgi:formylglycine-generating enzyme required for sulfatase activity
MVVIPRTFAIATKEVTVEQYQRFGMNMPDHGFGVDQYSPECDGPQNGPSWYDAVAYCNWLSAQEGLPNNQWCYIPNEAGAYAAGMSIPADVLERTGYRLPTEAEWEYACRAGAVTSRYYGHSIALLDAYAWYQSSGRGRAWTCGHLNSNDLGLFDMLGNLYEWCQSRYVSSEPGKGKKRCDRINISEIIREKIPRTIRGGSFSILPPKVRSANRDSLPPASRGNNFGFRLCKTCR